MIQSQVFPKMHVSLYVSNLNESLAFYTRFFGQEAAKVAPGYFKFELNQPALIISFLENPERVNTNFGHLGIQVASKEEVLARLGFVEQQGLVAKEEIDTACCYAVQDKFWVNDPDGTQWEIYYFHKDVAFNDPKFENGEATACCAPPAMEKQKVKIGEKVAETSCDPQSGCC
ncbi:MAG: catechol 2,3-dioxygenase-like lactoylglutathione lyase family enzyme [Candidatus Azotimanducaceae bacterium]|jgi:catechol 2,3-dioxygenase-like lactoylglutathione lyase family enzyme